MPSGARWALVVVTGALSILFGVALVQRFSSPAAVDKTTAKKAVETSSSAETGRSVSGTAEAGSPGVSDRSRATPADTGALRKILLQYRNSRPFQVELIGDFNDWQPGKHVMARGMDHMWRVTVPLAPGRFGYQFVVDGKTIRDPANRRFQKDPRRGLISIVEVKPKSR